MLQWLRLAVWLLLSAAVSGEEVQCDVGYGNYCWNSTTHRFNYCWSCRINDQQTTDNELSIAPKHPNGTDIDVQLVRFDGGDVTKMPKVINKNIIKQILNVGLQKTKTRVLDAQFFENVAKNMIYFVSYQNDNLSVVASAFKNFASLEALRLADNGISSISPDAFRGLNKLVWLNLNVNNLTLINETLFDDLGNLEVLDLSENQLTEVDDTAFENLHKLKELYLYQNKIEVVRRGMFQYNQQLETIYLINNQIKVIQSGSFVHVGKLFGLYLSGNKCIDKDFENKNPEEISAALTACLPTICVVPVIPNGFIINTFDDVTETPGNDLDTFHSAKVVCNENFTLFHEKKIQTDIICWKDGWTSHQWSKCERVCSPKDLIHFSISTLCHRNGENVPISSHLRPGINATIRCNFGYKKPTNVSLELTCLTSGEWSPPPFKCEPICGRVADHSTALQINSKDTNVTEVPWHVGLYQKGEQICGGTIVTERLVISAAHCFSDSTDFTHKFDVKTYKVAAGKYKRELDAEETLKTQIWDVLEVQISRMYDGHKTWQADITTILINGHFEYQQHIAPACLEFVEDPTKNYPLNGTLALVAGWGINENHQSSEILQSFDIPVLDLDTCYAKAPFDFKAKVIEDKICAGYIDSNVKYSKVVCKGDSGGGLLVSQIVDGEKRYFLQGVVSNSRQTNTCDTTFYTLFTNVQHYKNFLNEGIEKSADPWVEMVTVAPPVKSLRTTPVAVTSPVTTPVAVTSPVTTPVAVMSPVTTPVTTSVSTSMTTPVTTPVTTFVTNPVTVTSPVTPPPVDDDKSIKWWPFSNWTILFFFVICLVIFLIVFLLYCRN